MHAPGTGSTGIAVLALKFSGAQPNKSDNYPEDTKHTETHKSLSAAPARERSRVIIPLRSADCVKRKLGYASGEQEIYLREQWFTKRTSKMRLPGPSICLKRTAGACARRCCHPRTYRLNEAAHMGRILELQR
jgi:hypothetical protein